MKRVALYVLANLSVLALLATVVHLLGVDAVLAPHGIDSARLLVLAAILGFAGSLISLAVSKWTARHLMGVQIIGEPANAQQAWLVGEIAALAHRVGIRMPEVGIFDVPQMNAFATGARRNHALVAVSTGLLSSMTREEARAVLGHEITHVANGDMVTLALIQGVVNTFVIFLSRVLAAILESAIGRSRAQHREESGPLYFFFVVVLQIGLGLLANLIVMAFSRRREFRADGGGAQLAGTRSMIAALERLADSENVALPGQMAAFGISGQFSSGIAQLLMSHPPIVARIAALRSARYT